MTTELLFRDNAYLKTATARVVAVHERGIELDRTIFYPQGGGQMGAARRTIQNEKTSPPKNMISPAITKTVASTALSRSGRPRAGSRSASSPPPVGGVGGGTRPFARAGRCRREVPLVLRLEDGVLVEGVADLAFAEDGCWTVVDFKTDVELGSRLAEYRRQVALYARAIAAATGQPATAVLLRL